MKHNIGFKEKRHFFHRKLAKIAENCKFGSSSSDSAVSDEEFVGARLNKSVSTRPPFAPEGSKIDVRRRHTVTRVLTRPPSLDRPRAEHCHRRQRKRQRRWFIARSRCYDC
jgi:hypothetical protein